MDQSVCHSGFQDPTLIVYSKYRHLDHGGNLTLGACYSGISRVIALSVNSSITHLMEYPKTQPTTWSTIGSFTSASPNPQLSSTLAVPAMAVLITLLMTHPSLICTIETTIMWIKNAAYEHLPILPHNPSNREESLKSCSPAAPNR